MCLKVCAVHLRGKCERDSGKYFHAPCHLRSRVRDVAVGPAATLNSPLNNPNMVAAYAFPSSFYNLGEDLLMIGMNNSLI